MLKKFFVISEKMSSGTEEDVELRDLVAKVLGQKKKKLILLFSRPREIKNVNLQSLKEIIWRCQTVSGVIKE